MMNSMTMAYGVGMYFIPVLFTAFMFQYARLRLANMYSAAPDPHVGRKHVCHMFLTLSVMMGLIGLTASATDFADRAFDPLKAGAAAAATVPATPQAPPQWFPPQDAEVQQAAAVVPAAPTGAVVGGASATMPLPPVAPAPAVPQPLPVVQPLPIVQPPAMPPPPPLMPAAAVPAKPLFNDAQRAAAALVISAAFYGLLCVVALRVCTNDREVPTVRRAHIGLRGFLAGLVTMFITTSTLLLVLAEGPSNWDSLAKTAGAGVVWGPAAAAHLGLLLWDRKRRAAAGDE